MKLSEDLHLLEWEYPSHKVSNPILHNLIEDNKHRVDGQTGRYYITHFKEEPAEVKSLLDWTLNKIATDIVDIPLVCSESWGVIYDDGDYINAHTHKQGDLVDCSTPNYFSFVYYVNAPEGSSPLIFPTSGYELQPKSGNMVVFESRLRHEIPPNGGKNRSIIVGNFIAAEPAGIEGHFVL